MVSHDEITVCTNRENTDQDRYPGCSSYEKVGDDNVGWGIPGDPLSIYVGSDKYNHPDINCHFDAFPASRHVTVAAGGKVTVLWSDWNAFGNHKGPIFDYLADCHGPCEQVDKTTLKWVKIAQAGLEIDSVPGTNEMGRWALDDIKEHNSTWDVTIPSNWKAGNYVLRTEIIGLHDNDPFPKGPQHYPMCFNLEITGGGTDNPEGTLGTDLYSLDQPGLSVTMDIYVPLPNHVYPYPGPPLYTPGSNPNPAPVTPSSSIVSALASPTPSVELASSSSSTEQPPAPPTPSVEPASSSSSEQSPAAMTSVPEPAPTFDAPAPVYVPPSTDTSSLPSDSVGPSSSQSSTDATETSSSPDQSCQAVQTVTMLTTTTVTVVSSII